jgi:ATP-dependent Lhr-like helicase
MALAPSALPEPFAGWFARRGWEPHPHQLALLARAEDPATLLIAPTGGGKTLAGFLPSLIELGAKPPPGLHTLYVSPLKALAADIRRNLAAPVAEMGLAIRVEDRTGDTGSGARRRQRADPPHVLLTTPESLALMLSYEQAPDIFRGLRRVVLDEIHALAESKRGDQLMLGLARLRRLAPGLRVVALSATVEDRPTSPASSLPTPACCWPIPAPSPTSRCSPPPSPRPGRPRAAATPRAP